jgi:hypothetical protein
VLLLVIEPERQALLDGRAVAWSTRVHEVRHVPVDVRPVSIDLFDGRTGERVPFRTGVERSDSVVVRVEEVFVARVERAVTLQVRLQKKRLEEPCDVGEMPLRRTRIEDALHLVIIGLERCAERFRLPAHFAIAGVRIGCAR